MKKKMSQETKKNFCLQGNIKLTQIGIENGQKKDSQRRISWRSRKGSFIFCKGVLRTLGRGKAQIEDETRERAEGLPRSFVFWCENQKIGKDGEKEGKGIEGL